MEWKESIDSRFNESNEEDAIMRQSICGVKFASNDSRAFSLIDKCALTC